MSKSEHILMESDDRRIPDRRTALKVHAELRFRSRLRRRAVTLEVIDYYFLYVRIARPRAPAFEYVLDLRFVDPTLMQSRHVAWRWIAASLALIAMVSGVVWWIASAPPPWWQHGAIPLAAAILVASIVTAGISAYRTTESLTLRSIHGKARVFECVGGIGTLRAIRPFTAKLAAHIQIAVAARRARTAEHLRDEMREHFRLKEAGVLPVDEYERSKALILRTHGS